MAVQISCKEADWSRERIGFLQWRPSARLIRAVRQHQHWKSRGRWAWPLRALSAMRVRTWNIVCGSDIPVGATLGGGLMLPHPCGVVMHPDVQVGVNCMIFQGVTLGFGGPKPGVPTIGGHVDIGAGAKVLGGVIVGNHARIGANAVVLCDVPEGTTAVGVPARIVMCPETSSDSLAVATTTITATASVGNDAQVAETTVVSDGKVSALGA